MGKREDAHQKIKYFLKNNLLRGQDDAAALRTRIHYALVDPSPNNIFGFLMQCCGKNAQNCARLLVEEYDAPLHMQRQRDGNTALHQAAYYGSFEVVQIILQRGGHNERKNKHGETPSDCAREGGYQEIVELIDSLKIKKTPSSQKKPPVDEGTYVREKLANAEIECKKLFLDGDYKTAATFQPEINMIKSDIECLEQNPKEYALKRIKNKCVDLLKFYGPLKLNQIPKLYRAVFGQNLRNQKDYELKLMDLLQSIPGVALRDGSPHIYELDEKYEDDNQCTSSSRLLFYHQSVTLSRFRLVLEILAAGDWHRNNCPEQLREGVWGNFEHLFDCIDAAAKESELLHVYSTVIRDMMTGCYVSSRDAITKRDQKRVVDSYMSIIEEFDDPVITSGMSVLFRLDDGSSLSRLCQLEHETGPNVEWIKQGLLKMVADQEFEETLADQDWKEVKSEIPQREMECKLLFENGQYEELAKFQSRINKLKSIIEIRNNPKTRQLKGVRKQIRKYLRDQGPSAPERLTEEWELLQENELKLLGFNSLQDFMDTVPDVVLSEDSDTFWLDTSLQEKQDNAVKLVQSYETLGVTEFTERYHERFGSECSFQRHGFRTMYEFLDSIGDLTRVSPNKYGLTIIISIEEYRDNVIQLFGDYQSVALKDVIPFYKKKFGSSLPYRDFGFKRLKDFIRTIDEIYQIDERTYGLKTKKRVSDMDEKEYLSKTLGILQNECKVLFEQKEYQKAAGLQPEINQIKTNIEDLQLRPEHFTLQSIKGKLAQLLQFCGPLKISRITPSYSAIYGEPLSLKKQYNTKLFKALGSIENVNFHKDEKTGERVFKLENPGNDLTTTLICDFSEDTPVALFGTIMRIVQSGDWYRQNCPVQLREGITEHFETLFYFLHKYRKCGEKDFVRSSVLSSIIEDMLAGFYFHHKNKVTKAVRRQADDFLRNHHKTIGNQVIIDGILVLFGLDDPHMYTIDYLMELERNAGSGAEWIKEAVRDGIRQGEIPEEKMTIAEVKKHLQQKETDCKILYEAGMYRDSAQLQPQINKLKSIIEENGPNHPKIKAQKRVVKCLRKHGPLRDDRMVGEFSKMFKEGLHLKTLGFKTLHTFMASIPNVEFGKTSKRFMLIESNSLEQDLTVQHFQHNSLSLFEEYGAPVNAAQIPTLYLKTFNESLGFKKLGFKKLKDFLGSMDFIEKVTPNEYAIQKDAPAADLHESKLSAEQHADNASQSSESVPEHETKHEETKHNYESSNEAKLVIDGDHVEDSPRSDIHDQLEQQTSIQPQYPTRVQHEPSASIHQKHGISEEISTPSSTTSDSKSTPFVDEHGSSFVAPQNSAMQFAKIINLIDDAEEADPPLLNETEAESLQALARNNDGELLFIFKTCEQFEESKRMKRFVKNAKRILKSRE